MSVPVARRQLLSEPTRLPATMLAVAAGTAAGGRARFAKTT